MKVELIPVIELVYSNSGIAWPLPEKHPYWENPEVWDDFRQKSYAKAGFIDGLQAYLKGSPFFEPKKLSDTNLKKIVLDKIDELRSGEYDPENANCLGGGFVLKVNDRNKYFPQCCGELGDIKYWKKISEGTNSYYEGHPAPKLQFTSNTVIFDFSVLEFDEHFEPPPEDTRLEIELAELRIAVSKAKSELSTLAERMVKINDEKNLNIERIDNLLICGNPDRE